jgi:hypothetical protein
MAKIKVGTKLVACNKCKMRDGSGNALIVGKTYEVKDIQGDEFSITSEQHKRHVFDMSDVPGVFFDFKKKDKSDKVFDAIVFLRKKGYRVDFPGQPIPF